MVGGPDLAVTVASILVPFVVMGGIWILARYLLRGEESNNERKVPDSVNHQARTIPGGRSD